MLQLAQGAATRRRFGAAAVTLRCVRCACSHGMRAALRALTRPLPQGRITRWRASRWERWRGSRSCSTQTQCARCAQDGCVRAVCSRAPPRSNPLHVVLPFFPSFGSFAFFCFLLLCFAFPSFFLVVGGGYALSWLSLPAYAPRDRHLGGMKSSPCLLTSLESSPCFVRARGA